MMRSVIMIINKPLYDIEMRCAALAFEPRKCIEESFLPSNLGVQC